MMDRMQSGQTVILDGGTGTELETRNVPMNAAWCSIASVSNPDDVTQVHLDYINAGAEMITANTFASSRLMLNHAGLGDRIEEIITASMDCVKRARDAAGKDVAIAGSISHMIPIAPGSDNDFLAIPEADVVRDAFAEIANLLHKNGADFIALEMMYDLTRAPLAIEAAAATGLPVWCGMSVRRGADDSIVCFTKNEDVPFDDLWDVIDHSKLAAAGFMHSHVDITGRAIERLKTRWDGPLIAYPDSGYFKSPVWQFVDIIEPADLVSYAREWHKLGVRGIGGCCGLGVKHIEALAAADWP